MRAHNSKLGWFTVSARALREPEGLVGLFTGVIVLQAELRMDTGAVRYLAWHESFEPLQMGQEAPRYEPRFDPGAAVPRWVKWMEVPR